MKRVLIVFLGLFLNAAVLMAGMKPNILLIMVDDMGYSDIGCYGGEIETPNLDRLAANGLRYSQFYNTSKCNTSREALLSGRYVTRVTEHKNFAVGPTLGELAQQAGYRTLMAGKNHNKIRPTERGFDRFFGLQGGLSNFFCPARETADGRPLPYSSTSLVEWMVDDQWVEPFVPQDPEFYVTDAITDNGIQWLKEYEGEEKPFLLYLAYTAPHYPIQARAEDVAKYDGRYDAGYQVIQNQRYERMIGLGVIDPETSPLHPQKKKQWDSLSAEEQQQEANRMEVHAAMVDRVDQNIGRVLDELAAQGKLENTLILFLSDNGAERVYIKPDKDAYQPNGREVQGGAFTWDAIGQQWAYVANTPLGYFKKTSHEGGIRTPMIAYWPKGIKKTNRWCREPAHLVDIMATFLDLSDLNYPEQFNGRPAKPIEGISLVPSFSEEELPSREYKIGNDYKFGKMIRDGKWKLVKYKDDPWELYDMSTDNTETKNLAQQMPEKVSEMKKTYAQWEQNCQSGL
ncbi:arylsulfatase [Pontiella agarivorans]|uniref:Arylsulfatase n=1 Tax=Pontiella agarivorans TaxID=3038953 RepID=A0ABU5N1B8_9BACT|nr:arylsulfatase [Pontiella agarivorans]MDZ8120254.1 arylsulfatase [Pontiella agarivorans]